MSTKIMKKSIFILSALFVVTFADAQITLEGTIPGKFPVSLYVEDYYFDCGKIPVTYGDTLVELYNEDGSIYKTVRFAPSTQNSMSNVKHAPTATKGGPDNGLYLFTRNIFTTDGKVAFVKLANERLKVYDEDGTLVADLQDASYTFGIFPINGHMKLIIQESQWDTSTYTYIYTTYIYSLPGDGEATAVSTPSSPKRSARKIARDGQVLVQTDNNTYTLTGVEIK